MHGINKQTMNHTNNIHYIIHTTPKESFAVMVSRLLEKIQDDNALILRLVFFGAPQSNDEYREQSGILHNLVKERFGDKIPALSYISQPPLNSGLVMEVHSYSPGENGIVSYKNKSDIQYIIIENKLGRLLFVGGIQSDISLPIEKQSEDVFRLLGQILADEGFKINDIVRQWNYIERITDYEGENQNYQSFNNARSDFYNKTEWVNGYPAATGIGMNHGGIVVDVDVIDFVSGEGSIIPIDNKLQVAAHKYSENVLENARLHKATPKFERAKAIVLDNNRLVYISGTAAIRGEESLKDVGLEEQLRITMENICQLTDDAEIAMLRVYFRDAVAESEIEELMRPYDIHYPVSYVRANVCRNELLIEIEGIAIK